MVEKVLRDSVTLTLDSNGTSWEHDLYGTQLRHGGDAQGLQDSLDYLQGLGIRGIYLAGSLLYNMPWESDTYSPLVSRPVSNLLETL